MEVASEPVSDPSSDLSSNLSGKPLASRSDKQGGERSI